MTTTSSSIRKQVGRLFRQLHARRYDACRNPVTGLTFQWGVDSISEQKLEACRALVAREWHAQASPMAPVLPVDALEIDAMKSGGGERHLFAYYAQSIHCRGYSVSGYPSWETYARGVLASPYAPDFLTQDAELLTRFPPRRMRGLTPYLTWEPPKQHAITMQHYTFSLQTAEAGYDAPDW
jgi:hypothetical protein